MFHGSSHVSSLSEQWLLVLISHCVKYSVIFNGIYRGPVFQGSLENYMRIYFLHPGYMIPYGSVQVREKIDLSKTNMIVQNENFGNKVVILLLSNKPHQSDHMYLLEYFHANIKMDDTSNCVGRWWNFCQPLCIKHSLLDTCHMNIISHVIKLNHNWLNFFNFTGGTCV